jgi:exonuclease SbcC
MKIKAIKVTNFLGIDEFNFSPSGINIFTGAKGAGKSSILEAIEAAITNTKRRTEVIKHGEDEATLFVELDNGLEINRKLRAQKSDYFKLNKTGESVKSTESEIRKLLSGDIFRPLDFIGMKQSEQTAIILNMIKMEYSEDDIKQWFGEGINIDTSKHLLQTLKDIETTCYTERQDANRSITTLKNQVSGIEKTLPPNYDGDEWKDVSLKLYYDEISEAQKVNNLIAEANRLKDSIDISIENISISARNKIANVKADSIDHAQSIRDEIANLRSKIAIQENNLEQLREIEEAKIRDINMEKEELISKEKTRVEKAAKYIESNSITDIKPIEAEIDNILKMQSYLREWERMNTIKTGVLKDEIARSEKLSKMIDTARSKPSEILQKHKLPIDGISVDENSMIRINGTLLDGLSDGEKLEAAFKIALQRMGELRVICLDGFEKLNESEQKKIVELCESNDIQAFITITMDTENNAVNTKHEL